MRKFRVVVETGYPGCNLVGSFEIEDNATEEEIEAKNAKSRAEIDKKQELILE